MCDWDDFEDFEDEGFDEDSFEDQFEEFTDDVDDTDESSTRDESGFDEFNARDAFFLGSAMGFAYEEGLHEQRRRGLLRKKQTKTDKDFG